MRTADGPRIAACRLQRQRPADRDILCVIQIDDLDVAAADERAQCRVVARRKRRGLHAAIDGERNFAVCQTLEGSRRRLFVQAESDAERAEKLRPRMLGTVTLNHSSRVRPQRDGLVSPPCAPRLAQRVCRRHSRSVRTPRGRGRTIRDRNRSQPIRR